MISLTGQEQLNTLSSLKEQYKGDDERPTRAMEDEALCKAQILKITKKARDKDISVGFRLALLEEARGGEREDTR